MGYINESFYVYFWNNENSLMWKNNLLRTKKFEKHLALVDSVFSCWKENNITDPFNDLIPWSVNFLYWDLKSFPQFLQISFAKRFVEILEKYYEKDSFALIGGCKSQMAEIYSLSETQSDPDVLIKEDISELKDRIAEIEKEIQSTLRSKTYRIGRLFTRPKNRINENDLFPKEQKKN